ncbi:hypothetical protein PVAP13_9KG167839 [Panicum virgatum]|uniref:Uncharacterized protein n=1 Tax=Panicum virgatum TaxID=38727 RepID=A0A8T0NR49_PANVG|nr:hypothetical protein PVAP13_9KG167839 [Panicum virgatum]
MQHQKEVEELKEKFESANSARERDREENKKQIEKMRDEFQSTLQQQIQLALQQAIPGLINTTKVPSGPSVDNNFITPQLIEDEAIKNNEPSSVLTTEKVVHDTAMTTKTSATRPLFQKKIGANAPLTQLLRTRNQKKKHQESADNQNI